MARWLKEHPYWSLITGMGLGLLVGVGMLMGALATVLVDENRALIPAETLLHATGSDSGDMMAVATGPIAEGVEGVFFLDFLTGDLSGWVMNRRTGGVGGLYKRNVIGDLGVVQGKKQKFLLVTGAAAMTRGGSQARAADCIVYVADQNTGNFAAYGLAVNSTAYATGRAQISPMILIGKGSARNVDLRVP